MKKISRSLTVIKKIFPVLWLGGMGAFLTAAFADTGFRAEKWLFLAIPVFITVFFVVMLKNLVRDLMDEVQDGGDFLLVRKGSEEERIPLSPQPVKSFPQCLQYTSLRDSMADRVQEHCRDQVSRRSVTIQ